MHWLWGILLGLVLTAALPIVAALLSLNDRVVNQDESLLAAIALVLFCLLGVLIFKPAEATKPVRMLRGRGREDEE